MNEDELLNKLAKLIEQKNKTQTEELKREIENKVHKIQQDIFDIKKCIREEAIRRDKWEDKQRNLERRCEYIERLTKKNNIIIFGLKYSAESAGNNLVDYTIEKLKLLLGVELSVSDIDNIYQVGKVSENRPIVVAFVSFLKKISILKVTRKLKGTKIFIAEDLTREEQEKRKLLAQHKKLALSKGLRAYIKRDKLYINGEEHTYESLQNNDDYVGLRKSNSAPPTPSQEEGCEFEFDCGEIHDPEAIEDRDKK